MPQTETPPRRTPNLQIYYTAKITQITLLAKKVITKCKKAGIKH